MKPKCHQINSGKILPTSLISFKPMAPIMNRPFPVLFISLISIISIGLINARLYKLQGNQQLMSDWMIQKSEIEGEFLYMFMEPPSAGFPFQSVEAAMLTAWLHLAQIPHYIFSTQFLLASPRGKPIFAQWKGEYLEGVDEIINKMGKWKLEKLKAAKAAKAKIRKNEKKDKNIKNNKNDKKDKKEKKDKKKDEKREKRVEEKWKKQVANKWQKMEEKERPFVEAIKDLHKILLKYWLEQKYWLGKNRFEWMANDQSIEERIWFTLLLPIVTKQPIWIEFNGGFIGGNIGENSLNKMQMKINEQILAEYYKIMMEGKDAKKLEFMKMYGILIEKDIDGIVEVNEASTSTLQFGEYEQRIWENFANKMKSLNKEMVENELSTMRREEVKLKESLSKLPIKVIAKSKIPIIKKTVTKKLAECTDDDLVKNLQILIKTIMKECERHIYSNKHLFNKKVPGKTEAYLLGLLFFIFQHPPIMENLPNFSKYFERDDFGKFTNKNIQTIYKYYAAKSWIFDRDMGKMMAWPWPMMGAYSNENLKDVESDMAESIRQAINVAQQTEGAQVDYPWLDGLVNLPLE